MVRDSTTANSVALHGSDSPEDRRDLVELYEDLSGPWRSTQRRRLKHSTRAWILDLLLHTQLRVDKGLPPTVMSKLVRIKARAWVLRDAGACAIETSNRGQKRDAQLQLEGMDTALRPLLGDARLELEREPLNPKSGRPFYVPKFPLNLTYQALSFESIIGLALLDELLGARTAGYCPYCHEWWTSPDSRRRVTCGRDECTDQRKLAWRRDNPEPRHKVLNRVREYRKRLRQAKINRRKGARHD